MRAASMTGRWTTSLDAHARQCPECRDVRVVASALAAGLVAAPLAIDPVLLWVRVRSAARIAAAARMSRILTVAQIGAASFVLVVFASFLRWPDIQAVAKAPDTGTLFAAGGFLLTAATVWLSRWATRF